MPRGKKWTVSSEDRVFSMSDSLAYDFSEVGENSLLKTHLKHVVLSYFMAYKKGHVMPKITKILLYL